MKGSAMASRERPKILTLTDAAAERMKQIMSRGEDGVIGLRVGVKKGGCAGMEYTMEYARDRAPHEDVVEDKGVRVFIEPKAILFLLGTEMDYKTERLSSGFVFKNPNETSACGCGESVAITPAQLDTAN
jgi:iron-sulfur cluster assembly protein